MGEGKDKSMQEMFVKQILQLPSCLNRKKKYKEKIKWGTGESWKVVVNCNPQTQSEQSPSFNSVANWCKMNCSVVLKQDLGVKCDPQFHTAASWSLEKPCKAEASQE